MDAGGVDRSLEEYVGSKIIPMYDSFDAGHDRSHALAVIEESLRLSAFYSVDVNVVYAAAAYHDTGLTAGREFHHLESGRIVRNDSRLSRWFTAEQIETIAQAVEDHRASASNEPRSIYGRILAESDRQIIPEFIILRTVQYGARHYPELDKESQWERLCGHMMEKYAPGGYLKLYIPESRNAEGLARLQEIINDKEWLRSLFERSYREAFGK